MILTTPQILRIAVEATADPRTVGRYLAGSRVHATSRDRIEKALRKLGLEDAIRAECRVEMPRRLAVVR